MGNRNPGCEALSKDNGRDTPYIPVCMGGAAVEGAFETIIGCNNPNACKPRMRNVPGCVIIFQTANGKVTGVADVHRDMASVSNTTSVPRIGNTDIHQSEVLAPLPTERTDVYSEELSKSEITAADVHAVVTNRQSESRTWLPAEWIVPGL